MLDYIIQVLLFQTLFLALYDLLLKKETFFQWNRTYLLVTSVMSYFIPLIKIRSIQESIPQEYTILLPEIMLTPATIIKETFDWSGLFFDVVQWVFWLGVVGMMLLFMFKLSSLFRLIYSNEKINKDSYQLVLLKTDKAFSFFNYIFLKEGLEEQPREQIIEHELVHVKQWHTLDLLFFELQKIIFWCNPFSYLFQRRIAELHEFIADAKIVKSVNKDDYFQSLLSQTFGTHKISFINSFFKISLVKKRIVMLNKNKSKEILRLKYLVLIPILVSMLVYSSCEKKEVVPLSKKENEKRTMIMYSGDGVVLEKEEMTTQIESYFDVFSKGATPPTGKEISYFDLSDEEREDFRKFRKAPTGIEEEKLNSEYKIYELENGRKALYEDLDFNDDAISFTNISKPPVFPGCEKTEDQKNCFSSNLSKYVAQNFDISSAESLELEAGTNKIYVQFKIDKDGVIADIKARAPHPILEEEAIRVVRSLPKMQAGEKANGEKVAVKFMLPIAFGIQ